MGPRLRLVAWLRLVFCFWPQHSSCLPRRKFFESQELALSDAKIGELRLQFSNLRADAFE